MGYLKHLLKKWFLILKIRSRFHAAVQVQQRQLYLKYRDNLNSGKLPKLSETGFRVFSQYEEDGKLLYLFSLLGMTHKTFVDIGSNDGINSNCANLIFNFNWYGLFIDGDKRCIERGEYFYNRYPNKWLYKPTFLHSLVTRENINDLIKNAGFSGETGLLSIDIDGDDFWIWEAINVINPQVVIIESHDTFGMQNLVVPYQAHYSSDNPLYHGASPAAMTKLAAKKGYRLVGANDLGFNLIFLRNDLLSELIPEVSVESVLIHPSAKESTKRFESIKDRKYEQA